VKKVTRSTQYTNATDGQTERHHTTAKDTPAAWLGCRHVAKT